MLTPVYLKWLPKVKFLLLSLSLLAALFSLSTPMIVSAETITCADNTVVEVAESDSSNPAALCANNGGVKTGARVESSAPNDPGTCKKPRFFGLPAWFEYLDYHKSDLTGRCEVVLRTAPDNKVDFMANFLPIGLAVLDLLLMVAGVITVGFIIYGGIKYILSQGQPDSTRAALHTIINALVGGVIAMMGVAIVSFIGSRLGG